MITELIIFTIFAACASVFLHYCIGSPIQGEFYSGRIFSFYGAFISKKYLEFEESEKRRVWAIYERWKAKKDEILNEELQGKTLEQAQQIYNKYLSEIESVYNNVENKMKPNPFSMLGACPICFSTWISFFCFGFFIIFVPFPWWFILIGTPAAVVLSRYIKIT